MLKAKADYRQYFASVKMWLKMNYFLKQVNIDSSNFSRFLRSDEHDYLVSIDKLNKLYEEIQKKLT